MFKPFGWPLVVVNAISIGFTYGYTDIPFTGWMTGITSCPAKTYYGSRFFAVINRLTDHFISLKYYEIIVAIIKFSTSGNKFIKPALEIKYA